MQDGTGFQYPKIDTPQYQPNLLERESTALRIPNLRGFQDNPELYDNIDVAHQSGLTNWWNTFVQGVQDTKTYMNASDLMDGLVKKAKLENRLDKLDSQFKLGDLDQGSYLTQKNDILTNLSQAYNDINEAKGYMAGHQESKAAHPVPKASTFKTNLALLQGSNASLGDYLKYALPNVMGSSAATLAATMTAGFAGKLVRSLATRAAAGIEGGPWGVALGAVAGLGTVIAENVWARNLESKAEVGSQFMQDYQELKSNFLVSKPQGYQPTEQEENNIILKAAAGSNEQYWKNMSLAVSDSVQSLIFAGAFTKMFRGLTNVSKFTRALGGVGELFVQSKLEGLEEGLQQAFQYEKQGKSFGLQDYMHQGHSLLQNYGDVLGSMKFLGFGGKGPYSDDEQFNSSVYAGQMLGVVFGGTHVAFTLSKDLGAYRSTGKELSALNPTKTEEPILRFKDDLYAQFLGPKAKGVLGIFNEDAKDRVFYFKEALKTLNKKLDREGNPLLTDEELSRELKDIDKAFHVFNSISSNLDAVLPPYGKNNKALNQVQKTEFRKELFHNTLGLQRLDLPSKEAEMLNAFQNESFSTPVSELATIQGKLEVINKRLQTSFGNYETFLKKEKKDLDKQFSSLSKTYQELEGKEAILPGISMDTYKAVNDYYDVAETKFDYIEKRNVLSKVKDWNRLTKWFDSYKKTAGAQALASYERSTIEDNATFAAEVEKERVGDFISLTEEQQKSRTARNKETLDRGGYGKSYIDTLTPEQLDIEAAKVLDDFKNNVPRMTEDQVLHAISELGNKDELSVLLSRPSFRATFSKLGFNEAEELNALKLGAQARVQVLIEQRSKAKKRAPLPGEKQYAGIVGRVKSRTDKRETAELRTQFHVKEGKASQREVLQAIIESSYSLEPEKELAKKLLEITQNEEIEFGDLTKEVNGKIVRTASGRTILEKGKVRVVIDLNTIGDEFEGNENSQPVETVILHELIHRYTVQALDQDEDLRAQVNALIEKVKSQTEGKVYNGLKNAEEFVADAMTSPEFQRLLASVKGEKKQTAWESFINAVAGALKRLFGLDIRGSVLEDAIALTTGIIEGNKKINLVELSERFQTRVDDELGKIDPNSKLAEGALAKAYQDLYLEIMNDESEFLDNVRPDILNYLNAKERELNQKILDARKDRNTITFRGKQYTKGSYVVVKGYSDPYFVIGGNGDTLDLGFSEGATSRKLTLKEPGPIILVGTKAETEYFLLEQNKPIETREDFTAPVLFKSTGAQILDKDGNIIEQTDPVETRYYNFLSNFSKLSKSPYFGLLVQDEYSYQTVPIPKAQNVQDYLAKGGKRGQVVIIVDATGKPVLFDNNGVPSDTGSAVSFNIETPEKIMKRDSKKLAQALNISLSQADTIKLDAARKVREIRQSASEGKPVILRLKSVSPGVGFKDIVNEVETRPITIEEAQSVIHITTFLKDYVNQELKDFLFNYILGKGDYKVSGGKILYQGNEVAPTVDMITQNFSLKKVYDFVEKNNPYNVLDVNFYPNKNPEIITKISYTSYQDYLKKVSNLKSDITQSKYNRYLIYEIGEQKEEKKIDELPPKQSFDEGGNLFDSPIREFETPAITNDLGLFNNVTTYHLVKTIDKGIHSYLRLTDTKTIGEATEDPNFISNVLSITQKNILAKLDQLRPLRESQLEQGKISEAVYKQELSKINDKVEKLVGNWGEIVNYYLKNSYVFSYSKEVKYAYDTTGNLVREGDDTVAHEKGFDKIGNEVSPIDGASKEIKALVRGLSKFKEVDGKWMKVLNEFNVPDLNNFTVTWNNLLKNLNGLSDFSEMMTKLDSLTNTFPEYEELLDIMRKYYGKAQTGDVESRRMVALFKRDLSKPEVPIIENVISVEGSSTSFKIDEATRKNTRELSRIFLENFRTKSPYRVTTSAGNIALGKNILNQPAGTKQDRIKFFESLGFKFSPETVTDPSFDQLTNSSVVALFKADIKKLQEAGIVIKDPLVDLSKRTKVTEGLAKRINNLLELESKYSRVAPSLSMQNVENNTEWAISDPNGYTITISAINDAQKYPTYQDLVVEPQFSHLGKPYARTSHILNQIFILDSDLNFGKRRDDINPVTLELVNISGLKIEDTNGKKTTTLYIGDKIVSDFNQLLKGGYKEVMRAGDKNSAFSIKTSGFYQEGKRLRLPIANFKLFDNNNYGGEQLTRIMQNYLSGEINRIYLGLNGYLDDINKLGNLVKEFSLLRDVFSKNTKDKIEIEINVLKNLEPNSQELYDATNTIAARFMSLNQTNQEIKSFFLQEVIKKQESLNKYGFFFNKNYWLDDSLKPYHKDTLLRAYIVNEFILHVEQTKLVNGDIVFYSHKDGEFHKRNPKDGATGIIPITDSWWVDAANKDPNNNLQSKLLGVNNDYSNVVKTVVFRELFVSSAYLNDWSTYLKSTGLTDTQVKRIVDPYKENKEADAQGWVTMDFYRNFKMSIGAWTSEQEKVYEKVSKGEALSNDEVETLHRLFPPIKAQYAGPVAHEYYHVPGFHKFSLMPLLPSAIKGTGLERLNERMVRHNISYALLESGSKVGTIVGKKGLEPFYEDKDARTMSNPNRPFNKENHIYMHYLKEQVQIEPELHNEVIYGTQFRKLLFQNVYSNGSPVNSKLAKLNDEYERIISEITEFEKSKLVKELGVEPELTDGILSGYKVINMTKLVERLNKEIEKRKLNDNIKQFFQLENGNLKYTLDASQNQQQIRNMVMSMVNNRLIRQTIKGDMLIQGASTGYEKYVKPTETEVLKYGTNGLRFYHVKNGKVQTMQVKVPLTGDFKHLLVLNWNGEKIDTLDRLNQALKDETWIEANRKLITMVGYRIPTQGLNSIEVMEVAEFLPPEAGNILIVPTEIVTKSGSDFDIDKLNVFKPSIRYNQKDDTAEYLNKPTKKIDFTKFEKLDRLDRVQEDMKEIQDNINYIQSKLKEQFDANTYETLVALRADMSELIIEQAVVIDELNEISNYRGGLFNRIIELAKERITDPSSFKDLITPNSVDLIKPVIENDLGVKAKSYKHTVNLLSSTQEEKYLAGIPNKSALGISAVANTFSQLLSKVGLKLNDTFHGKNVYHPMIDAPYSMSNRFLKGGLPKSDIASQMINAYVDVLNDDFIAKANLSIDTSGPFFYLFHLGHNPYQLIYFFNNPIIKSFVAEIQKSRSLLIKNLDPTFDIKQARRIAFARVVDPSDERSLKALRITGENLIEPRYFSVEHLKNSLNKPLSTFSKEERLAVLSYYMNVLDESQDQFTLQQINNYDTSTSVNPISHEYREFLKLGLIAGGLFKGNIEAITDKTVIKPFNQYNLISSLLDALLPFSLNSNIRKEIVNIIEELSKNFALDADPEKIARTFINDWLYYIYINQGKLKDGRNIGDYGKSLLFGETRLSEPLLDFKTLDKWSRLREEFPFLTQLRIDQSGSIFNISLYRDDNSTEYQNSLIEQFLTLGNFDDPTYSPEDQNEIKKFARNLAILGFTQSGLNKSPISFTDVIPNDFYVPIMDEALKSWKGLSEKERFYQFNEFIPRFRVQNPQLFGQRRGEIPYWRFKDYSSALKPEAVKDHAMSYKMPASENLTGKDTSTVELAEQGLRTATTRSFPLGKVGDIITFEGRPQRYVITELEQIGYENANDPTWLKSWSQKEGWTVEHFKKIFGGSTVHIGSWQTTFKKIEDVNQAKVDLNKSNISEAQKKWLSKDQYKSDNSTKFIGRGVGATGEYARLSQEAGKPVNSGKYSSSDIVFISANGARSNRLSPDLNEIQKAINVGAQFLTDAKARRPEGGNPYNIGEQEVADFLRSKGYTETEEFNGLVARWKPAQNQFESPILPDQLNTVYLNEGTYQGLLRNLLESQLITPKCN